MVESSLGNLREESSELRDDLIGRGEDFEALLAIALRVSDKVTVIFFTEPSIILGSFVRRVISSKRSSGFREPLPVADCS